MNRAKRHTKYAELIKLGELTPSPPSNNDYKDFLVEAYKKHSAELASIEDRLNRFLLVILGVFGAGAAAIPKVTLTHWPAWVLVFVVVVFAAFGLHYNSEIRGVRAEVRYLLVRCEIDMGFYTPKQRGKDTPQANKQLYTNDELSYPTKGGFLEGTYAAVISAAAIGLILLIYAHAYLPVQATNSVAK
jgi:hypothetical protein